MYNQIKAFLNSHFSFSKTGCHTNVKEPSLPYDLSLAGWRILGFISFQRVLALYERQNASYWIWTLVSLYISFTPCKPPHMSKYTYKPTFCIYYVSKLTNCSRNSYKNKMYIFIYVRELSVQSWEQLEGFLFNSNYTEVLRGGCYSFPCIILFIFDPYLIMLSVKQRGIKYYFLSLWYDSNEDWTHFSGTIAKHSYHYANWLVHYVYMYLKPENNLHNFSYILYMLSS